VILCRYIPRSLDRHFSGTTNDDVHERVKMCPVFQAFVDTPQVQRLRHLRQLATADYTYMNAGHNRFEHSVGVAHLAESMCRRLQASQPKLNISDKDVLCVKLAGLCHDLGHGVYSHVYEEFVNNKVKKYLNKNPDLLKHYEGLPAAPAKWDHEATSLMMLDAALESLGLAIDMKNLDKPLLQIGDGIKADNIRVYHPSDDENDKVDTESILTSRDFVFIKECILGKPIQPCPVNEERSGFVGRPYRREEFLYDIVHNRHNGLDVDKIDYFARDTRRTIRGKGLDVRFIDEAVVAQGECPRPDKCHACTKGNPGKHMMVCYPEKMLLDGNAMEFFNQRFKLHKQVYTHKAAAAATFMIYDILTKADPYYRIPTYMDSEWSLKSDERTNELPISRAMLHKTSYLRLRDSVIELIMATTSPELRESRLLIERLWNRDLYKCVGRKTLDLTNAAEAAIWEMNEDEIASDFVKINGTHNDGKGSFIYLEEEDIIVEKYKIHHGAGEDNPVSLMRFVPKDQKHKLTGPIEGLPIARAPPKGGDGNTPVKMQEQILRIYCRGGEEKQDLLKHVYKLWESNNVALGVVTAECSSDSDSDNDEHRESVPLTQEEDESSVGTPLRGGHRYESDGEPSPFPSRQMR